MRYLKAVFVLLFVSGSVALAAPDVTKKSETKMEFKGALGTMLKIMGATKPTYQAEYLKGDVLRSDDLDKKGKVESTQIIDLNREVFINIDHKKKSYTEMTFAEWQEMMTARMEEAKKRASERESGDPEKGDTKKADEPKVEWKFDVSVDRPGDKKQLAGHEAEKAVITLKVEANVEAKNEETGETERGRGGLIVTSTNWLVQASEIESEYAAFQQKFAQKLSMQPTAMSMAEVMSSVMASNPQLGAAMERMAEESKKLDGVALVTSTVFETWGEGEKKEQADEGVPTSVGGLFKKLAKKPKDEKESAVLLEMHSEITEYNRNALPAELFKVPENYKKQDVKRP